MKRYTIGAVFNADFSRVLLILKNKPDWQKGKFNLPGGSMELVDNKTGSNYDKRKTKWETPQECISREFKEETDLDIPFQNWQHIGTIDNPGNYSVEFLTSIHYPELNGLPKSMTDEKVEWHDVDDLPQNVISNIHWLVPFAKNIWKQGNADGLKFGKFEYAY